ncbi:MAG: VPLPA-CTERM sorting domain-containing protein [Gammaproteobacteria bacterium]|nr:VPLPA-CTERM sorting domain-containing protein [Gammaproteobacteria bacterium]
MKTKMKMKAVAAALALVAAGTANAAIDTTATGNGELFFSIRDNTNLTSYVMDTNVSLDTFLANVNVSQSWAADATLTSYLSTGSGNYSWAVMAGDSIGAGAAGGLRYLSTAATGMAGTWATEKNVGMLGYSIMDTSYLTGANAAIAVGATGNSATFANGDAGYFGTAMDSWFNNSPMNAASAGLGGEQSFYYATNTGSTAAFATKNQTIAVSELIGTWTLDSLSGDLNYVATPIPAAVWLLGSAMVGLVGVARRREEDQIITA